jgi:phosphatidate cytidylyltransferase
MLKQRLITALILIPVFVLLLLKLPPRAFNELIIAFVVVGAWEWAGLMGLKKKSARIFYSIIVLALLIGLVSLAQYISAILVSSVAFWLLALLLVLLYPAASGLWGKSYLVRAVMGFFVLIPTFFALQFLHNTEMFGINRGPYILLFLFILIWGADSGAYFAGKKWGKTKLAPRVSPGKTWQGLLGAIGVTLILTPLFYYLFPAPQPQAWMLLVLTLLTVLFSVLGDLFESMLKRNVGIKDSGTLIPGHGGLLDRIDSLTAAAPLFALGCLLLFKILH